MTIVLAMDDVGPDQVIVTKNPKGPGKTNVRFFKATVDTPNNPTAWLAKYEPTRVSDAHFHQVDQFQIFLEGDGEFGHHTVSPYCVHFSHAYTPYGPLVAGNKTGFTFLTLRTRYDPGAQRLSENLDKLKQIPNRRPWQVSKQVSFASRASDIKLQEIPDIKNDQGLFAHTLDMMPNTQTTAPDPSGGDGQFVVIVKGSLLYSNKEHRALTVVFLKPEDGAFHLKAGSQGLNALILNFPQINSARVARVPPAAAAGLKKWQCELCAFVYDEAVGMPEEGIVAGTRWEDVPETWNCPDCSASKGDFRMAEI